MKKCTTTFKFCKCGFHTSLVIQQPKLFTPVIFELECNGCKSKYLVRCRHKPSMGATINVEATIRLMSDDLRAIIQEEEQQEAAPAS